MAKGRGQQRAKHGRQSDKGRGWVPRFYALLGIACLLLLWEIGHRAHGVLVLPGLGDTALTLWGMIKAGIVGPALAQTASNAISGWLIGLFAGTLAGAFAGLRDEVRFALQPVSVILLGIPAIAWVVLALLWFGGHWAVIFTVSIATAPITFAAATQGIRSLDDDLARMAKSFRTPVSAMLLDVHGPHMLSYLFPAIATTLAMSWKVSIMAELFSGSGGIGDGLAAARARVDTAQTMAWVVVVVLVLVLGDHMILQPLVRRLELWRADDIKRSS